MKTRSAICAFLTATAIVGLGMTPSWAGGTFDRTEIVSPAEFNSWRGNCTNLRAALDGITDASSGKTYAVLVEPSTYRCEDNAVIVKSWITVIGSGPQATLITGTADSGDLGVVNLRGNSAIKALTVRNLDPSVDVSGFAISVRPAEPDGVGADGVSIYYVTATSDDSVAVAVGPCSRAFIKGSTLVGHDEALLLESGECEGDDADVAVAHGWLIGDNPVVTLEAGTTAGFVGNGWDPLDDPELICDGDSGCDVDDGANAADCTASNYLNEDFSRAFTDDPGVCNNPP